MSPPHASRDVTGTVARPVAARPRRRLRPAVAAAALVCAASMLALGAWAFLAPASFAQLIDYPPYNRHLIHDAGAFQLGTGTAVLLALWWRDALVVALTGFAVASGLHSLSHAVDRQLGGHPSDVPALGLLTVVALFAIAVHLYWRKP